MFDNYLYVSGTSATLRKHFKELAEDSVNRLHPKSVLEIACNDGTLLSDYENLGCTITGIDPASNLIDMCKKRGLNVIQGYWSSAFADSVPSHDLIVALNVVPHVIDPLDFLIGMKKVMNPGGNIVIQFSQCDMLINNEFDAIYHEHCSYFTTRSLLAICERAGLYVQRVEKLPVHSKSSRWYLSDHINREDTTLGTIYNKEIEDHIYDLSVYKKFSLKAKEITLSLKDLIKKEKDSGRIVIGYGASAKWNTIANYGLIDLDYIVDDNPGKQGLLTPGRNTPIYDISKIDLSKPTTIICTAWNFLPEIKDRLKKLGITRGTRLVKYFPSIYIEEI